MDHLTDVIEAMKVMDRDYSGYRKQQALDYAMDHDLDTFDLHVLRGIAFSQILQEIAESKTKKQAILEKREKKTKELEAREKLFEGLEKGDWIGIIFKDDPKKKPRFLCVRGKDSETYTKLYGFCDVHFYSDQFPRLRVDHLIRDVHGDTFYLGKGIERSWLGKKLRTVPFAPSKQMNFGIRNKLDLESTSFYARNEHFLKTILR